MPHFVYMLLGVSVSWKLRLFSPLAIVYNGVRNMGCRYQFETLISILLFYGISRSHFHSNPASLGESPPFTVKKQAQRPQSQFAAGPRCHPRCPEKLLWDVGEGETGQI